MRLRFRSLLRSVGSYPREHPLYVRTRIEGVTRGRHHSPNARRARSRQAAFLYGKWVSPIVAVSRWRPAATPVAVSKNAKRDDAKRSA